MNYDQYLIFHFKDGSSLIKVSNDCKHPAGDYLEIDDECFDSLCRRQGIIPDEIAGIEICTDCEGAF